MAERMTHQEYVEDVRCRIVEVARRMLEKRLSFIEGARELSELSHEADVAKDDDDFEVFRLIDSETDALPRGEVRKHWSDSALRKLQPEIKRAERWACKEGTEACVRLIKRFGE
jgi:hypothetical protein